MIPDRQQPRRTPAKPTRTSTSTHHTPSSSMANVTLFSSSTDLSIAGGVAIPAEQEGWEALFDPESALLDYSPATARFHHQRRQQQQQQQRIAVDISEDDDDDEIATPPLPRIENMVVEPNADTPAHLNEMDILPCPSSSFFYPPQHQHLDRTQLLQDIQEQGLMDHHDRYHNMTIQEIEMQQQEHGAKEDAAGKEQKPNDETATCGEGEGEDDESKHRRWQQLLLRRPPSPPCRRVLLYFMLGFVLPPMWIVGAMHVPPQPASSPVDLLWKRRCRNAFFIFSVLALVVLIILLVFQPASIGWRHSPTDSSSIDDNLIGI